MTEAAFLVGYTDSQAQPRVWPVRERYFIRVPAAHMTAVVVTILALVVLPAAAAIAGVVVQRRFPSSSWMPIFITSSIVFAFLVAATMYFVIWLDWRALDRNQAAAIASGTLTKVTERNGRTEYEVDFPGGTWGRIIRFEFQPPIGQILQLGFIGGIMLGGVVLSARGIAKRRQLGRSLDHRQHLTGDTRE